MIIQIDDTWRIKSDSRQWIVEQYKGTRKNRQTGELESHWEGKMFYASYPQAVEGLANRLVRELNTHGLQEASDGIADVVKRLSRVLPEVACGDLDKAAPYKVDTSGQI